MNDSSETAQDKISWLDVALGFIISTFIWAMIISA